MAYNQSLSKAEILSRLYKLAKKYEQLVNKSFLFVNLSRKTGEYHWYEITFQPKNFMHLTGFKSTIHDATNFYEACLVNPPELDYENDCVAAYNHTRKEVCSKIIALEELLDLSKAKFFSVGEKNLITQYADFKFAYGKSAIIGFGNLSVKNNINNPPITCIPSNIENYCQHPYKVTFILEKKIAEKCYNQIRSEIKAGLTRELISSEGFPEELKEKIKLD